MRRIAILILLISLSLSGCKNREASLMGKWKFKNVTSTADLDSTQTGFLEKQYASSMYEFKEDGSVLITSDLSPSYTQNWKLKDNTITFSGITDGSTTSSTATFSNDCNTVTVSASKDDSVGLNYEKVSD